MKQNSMRFQLKSVIPAPLSSPSPLLFPRPFIPPSQYYGFDMDYTLAEYRTNYMEAETARYASKYLCT